MSGGRGLWIVDCGLWIVDCGLWIVDRGSWIVDRGSWIVDRGSWIVDRGSWIVDRGSWIVDRGSRIADRGLWRERCCPEGGQSPAEFNPKSEVEFLQWGKKTTDYTDYTDFLVWIFSPFATSEKLQMKPILIRVIRVIRG
jgi:hypothetical protein